VSARSAVLVDGPVEQQGRTGPQVAHQIERVKKYRSVVS
jgi:hypothetical protein